MNLSTGRTTEERDNKSTVCSLTTHNVNRKYDCFFLCNCLFCMLDLSFLEFLIGFCFAWFWTWYIDVKLEVIFYPRATFEVGSLWIWKLNLSKHKSFPLRFSQTLAFSWEDKTWNETSASSRIYQISLKAPEPFLSLTVVTDFPFPRPSVTCFTCLPTLNTR